jgi:cytochrome c oxidase subunit II
VTRRPRRRPTGAFAGLGALALLTLLLSGCSYADLPAQLGIPDPATAQGEITYHQWQAFWVAAWVVGAFTLVLILGAAFWFRRRKGAAVPAQTRYNLPIEVMYTITPLIIIGTLFYFTARDESRITAVTDDQDLTVNVVGYQWNWGFNYLDEDVYEAGTPQQLPTLYLPVDQKVRFVLTSPDVIHSFWVPDFLFKMDVIPGRTNQFELTPTEIGTYVGRCAEMCGTYHSQMLFNVEVVSQADYDAHIQQLRAEGQTGLLDTGRANSDAQQQGNTRFGPGGQNDLTNPLEQQ